MCTLVSVHTLRPMRARTHAQMQRNDSRYAFTRKKGGARTARETERPTLVATAVLTGNLAPTWRGLDSLSKVAIDSICTSILATRKFKTAIVNNFKITIPA